MEALSVEELALQRIFDLKNEVVLEFKSHQRLFDEALLSNVFLKGLDPPPWLSINGSREEIPVFLGRRPSYSAFRIGSDGKRVHRQDSVNRDFSKQERFSELCADFFYNRKRGSSSVDCPSCHEAVPAKKRRVESDFVVAQEIDGDRGKELGLDSLQEEKGEGQGFGDAQHGEKEERRDIVDEQHGRSEGGQGLFDAQLGRIEENDVSQEEDVKAVEKQAKGRPRGRGAKEKKNNVVSPFVGRITRSRAKQCQVLLSAKKDSGKKRSAARSKQPRGTRRNVRAKGAGGLEVSEGPKDGIELSPLAATAEPQIGDKSSPLVTAFGIDDQLPALPMETKSQIRNKSSPVVAESQVEAKLSPAMTRLQNEDHSSPVMNRSQIEVNVQRDEIGCTKGITEKKSEVKSASMVPACEGSKDIGHKSAQQEDALEMVERWTGEAVPSDDCQRSAGSCDAKQPEASNVTETSQKQETPNAIENVQPHEVSDLTESTQLKLRGEEHPMVFQNEFKDNLSLVEEGAEGEVPSVLRSIENRKSTHTMPVETTLVSNTTCTSQEMGAFQCHETFYGKVNLLADNSRITPPLVQAITSNPRYSGKSGLYDASRSSGRTYVLERLAFSDNVNLLGNGLVQEVPGSPLLDNGLVQEVPDSPSTEGTGQKLSTKANAIDMTITDVLSRNEREDTVAFGIGIRKASIYPNDKTHGNGLVQKVPDSPFLGNGSVQEVAGSPLLGNGLVQEVAGSPSIEGACHKLSMKANASDTTVTDVPWKNEREDIDASGTGLGKNSVCPDEKILVQDEIALYEERDKYEKVNSYSDVGCIHGRTASFDSAWGLSCYNVHKSESDITCDLTNKSRSRSLDFCKKNSGKETNNCSNIVVNVEGQDCLKAVSFSRFRSSSGSSEKLLSQGNEGRILKRTRSASPVDVNANVPSGGKENRVLQMPEDMDLMTKRIDEPFIYSQKSWDSQGKVGAYDSVLAISGQDGAAKGQFETLHNAPSKKLLYADIDFMDRTLLSSGKLFSRNIVEVNEEGGMKLQHNSWPKYQKRNFQVQQQFHSAGQPRLLRTESCSKILDYNTSISLSNGGVEVTSNDAGHIFQCDGVAKPCTSESKGNGDMENSEPRHDNILNIHVLKDFSCAGSNSSEAFPDQQSASLLSSQTNKDVEQSLGDSEHQHRAKLILEECSARMGLYPRQSLTDLGKAKCGIGNENVRRSSPSCLSYSTANEGAFGFTGLSQVRVDGMHFQATNNNTSASCLEGQAHLHATSSKSHSFRSSFEVTSPQNHGTEGGFKLLPVDDTVSDFSFQKGLSGMENNDMKSTPLLKGGVVRERARCSLAKSLLVNQNPLNQLKSAGLESHEIFSDEVDVNISELSQRKKSPSLEVDCQPEVNLTIDEFAKGAGGSLGMPQLAQPSHSFSSTNQTVDSVASGKLFQSTQLRSLHDVKMLQEFEGFNTGLFSKDERFSSVNGNEWMGIDMEYLGDENGKYSSMKGGVKATEFCKAFRSLTPTPNHLSKCRTVTPVNACSSHAIKLQEHKEISGGYQGKRYAMNDSYNAAHVLPTDKFQTRSGFNGVVGYGTKIKNSPSSTAAGGSFFERINKKFMDMDSNSFTKKVQMIKGHAGCFRIEEESGVEEESMDHPISMKPFENRFGSTTKKSVLGAKKMLMDSSSAKHNSPVRTPAGGKFFERISTNYMDTGSNLISKKASMNQNYTNCFHDGEDVEFEKENREPSVPVNEFQKNYGSSVKKVLRNRNTQAYSSSASHISPANSNHKSNNLLSNVRSFIPLVQQKQAATSIMTGKRDVKVKALEVAEAAKRMEEKREQERKMRKELTRRGEHEKNFQEKPKEERYRGEREGEEAIRTTSDCSNKSISNGVVRKKPVGCALSKSHAENSSQLDTAAYGVDLKLKRALEVKTKLEQEKVRKLEEEQKRKEEERKKKEAELAAKKRKREEVERRDREEKRKRLEEAQRQQKETEEQLRADKEVKEQRRRALDENERKRKAMEEEAKKQRRIEKEKEAAERRRRLEEDAKASKFLLKDAKHLEETHQQHEATLQAHKGSAGKVSGMCNNFSKSRQHETEGHSVPGIIDKLLQSTEPDINIQSYEISPYKGSDEEEDDEDDAPPGKFIPLWARKENLIQHLSRQQHIDPDEIFTGAKTCSLNEVFGTNGSLRRTDFNRRSKSGEWLTDKFTWKEEYQYKLEMGYINKG